MSKSKSKSPASGDNHTKRVQGPCCSGQTNTKQRPKQKAASRGWPELRTREWQSGPQGHAPGLAGQMRETPPPPPPPPVRAVQMKGGGASRMSKNQQQRQANGIIAPAHDKCHTFYRCRAGKHPSCSTAGWDWAV